MRRAVPILMYHEVAPDAAPAFRKYTAHPRAFALQMWWLAVAGYTPIGLDALVAHLAGRGSVPHRAVVITFDDGFAECLRHAVPVLRARRFTAIVYVVAGLVGSTSRWLVAERGVERRLADWPALRALDAAGLSCGSHTVTHPRLTALSSSECARELGESRRILEEGLGRAVRHLAYPFGAWSAEVAALAAGAGFVSACSVRVGLASGRDDVMALPRVPVTGTDTLLDFAVRLRTARTTAEAVRRPLGAARRWMRGARAA